jgi:tetratricopeptide (TPR) repeat protein
VGTTRDPFTQLPLDQKTLVNETCAQFEELLRSGAAPRVEDFVANHGGAVREVLLLELLILVFEHQLRQGGAIDLDERLRQFPDDQDLVQAAAEEARRYAAMRDGPRATARLSPDPGATQALPESIGRFRLKQVLGHGAFGTVFLAEDPQGGCQVALKVPHLATLLSPELRQRFLREAEVAGALDHPNLVKVREAGEAGLVCYMASDYVEGITLADWLRERKGSKRPLSPEFAANLTMVLARAIQHAHERGVSHCDLKPANVLLRHGLVASPVITDFGLAKLVGDRSDLTQSGQVLGTPAYMAPEQAAGQRRQITTRTDVYGLGAILYELLTGRPPFNGETFISILHRVLTEEPERPRTRDRRVPAALEAVCLKCLEKSPKRRYAGPAELADDLERWLRGESVRARAVGAIGRGLRWCGRKPWLAGLAGALVLTLVGGFAGSLYEWRQAELARRAAVESLGKEEAARQDAEDNFTMIRQVLDETVRVSDKPSLQTPAAAPERVALLLKAEGCYAILLRKRPRDQHLRALLSLVHEGLGAYYANQGQKAESLACFVKAAHLFEEQPNEGTSEPEYLSAGVWAHLWLGQAYECEGRKEPAEQAFESSLRLWQELARKPGIVYQENDAFHAGQEIAHFLFINGHSDDDIRQRFESLRSRPELLGGADQYELFLDLLRAELLHRRGAKARPPATLLADVREAAAILARHVQDAPPDRNCRFALARASLPVSVALRKGGALAEALRLAEPANRTLETLVREGPETGFLLTVLSSASLEVGKIRWDLDQPEETLAAYRGALEAQRRALALAPGEAVYRTHLGHRYLQLTRKLCELGRLAEAVACFQEQETLWPGNTARHADALREVYGWAKQVGEDNKELSPEMLRERQRYLDLCTRLEGRAPAAAPTTGNTKP